MELHYADYLRFGFSFIFVIALMLLIAWVARKMKLDERLQGLGRGKGRLLIEESLFIDSKRRIVALSDDSTRYLLLLGPNGDTLLSTITRPEVPHETR